MCTHCHFCIQYTRKIYKYDGKYCDSSIANWIYVCVMKYICEKCWNTYIYGLTLNQFLSLFKELSNGFLALHEYFFLK